MPPLFLLTRRRRPGYTLVEAMVALSLTAMAGAVVLLTVETSLDAANQSLEKTVAAGLAEQLIDEAAGAMYCEPGGDVYQSPLGPTSWESQGTRRHRFNEMGDFHGFDAQPPVDFWGNVMGQGEDGVGQRHPNFRAPGGRMDAWRQAVEVYYVDDEDPSRRLTSGVSDYRAVEVVISRDLPNGRSLELIRARRVFTHLPTLP